jgi:hypothetical protein
MDDETSTGREAGKYIAALEGSHQKVLEENHTYRMNGTSKNYRSHKRMKNRHFLQPFLIQT